MNDIVLSICIPTYNRADRIYQSLQELKNLPFQNIEFVVIDDFSQDATKEKVLSIKDDRIKFFRNRKNLGQEANVIKTFKKARGDFIFLISDEDSIGSEPISWIMQTTEEDPDVVQILGAIWNDNNSLLYYNPGDRVLEKGPQSLINLMFDHAYISGVILKREALDLKNSLKYVGSSYIHLYISIPVMLKGKTLCTSKVICHIGKPEEKYTFERSIRKTKKKILFNHPRSRLVQISFHIKIIEEITRNLPKLRKVLMKKEMELAATLIRSSCLSRKSFISGVFMLIKMIPYILQTKKISYSRLFWKYTMNGFYESFKNIDKPRK